MSDEEVREEALKIIEMQSQQILTCFWLDFFRDLAKGGDRLAAAFVEQTKTHPCFKCVHASAVFPRWPYECGGRKVVGYIGCSHESKERTEVATERCELYSERW